jgi:hypothetical protein
MDVQAYLNSGVIEDYCLGLLEPERREEVAQYALKYTQIKDAIAAYEYALKRFVEDTGTPFNSSSAIKEELLNVLKKSKK